MSTLNAFACIFSRLLAAGDLIFLQSGWCRLTRSWLHGTQAASQRENADKRLCFTRLHEGGQSWCPEFSIPPLIFTVAVLFSSSIQKWPNSPVFQDSSKMPLRWSDPVPAALSLHFCLSVRQQLRLMAIFYLCLHIQMDHLLYWVTPANI